MHAADGVSYLLPLRWSEDGGLDELREYLHWLATRLDEVLVVDASPQSRFDDHAARLGKVCRHIRPDPTLDYKMGKVNGVITGVHAARHERVVIADDDVRYDGESLARIASLLDGAHLVRPQNYFDPLPWHARLDTGRTLLNRLHTGDREFPRGDFPGTLAVRRSAFLATGGYDGDVMFENLELMRTIRAAGGVIASPLDLYVRRLPPSSSHYLSQRIRQAFDDFGIPLRLGAFLGVAPAVGVALRSGRRRALLAGAAAVAAAAEAGRCRAGGRRHYPASSSLLAPVWLGERGISAWLALASRLLRGGIRYAGRLVPRGANSPRELRRRLAGVDLPAPGSREPDRLVGAVAEGVQERAAATADRDHTAA